MDYFDELEQATIKKLTTVAGDYISAKFIEDTLNKMLKERRKILKGLDEYHRLAIIAIDSEIRQIKEIKKILLGGVK